MPISRQNLIVPNVSMLMVSPASAFFSEKGHSALVIDGNQHKKENRPNSFRQQSIRAIRENSETSWGRLMSFSFWVESPRLQRQWDVAQQKNVYSDNERSPPTATKTKRNYILSLKAFFWTSLETKCYIFKSPLHESSEHVHYWIYRNQVSEISIITCSYIFEINIFAYITCNAKNNNKPSRLICLENSSSIRLPST